MQISKVGNRKSFATARRQRQKEIEEKQGSNNSQTNKRCHIVVPYSQGLCESYRNICGRYGVQVHFKGGNTLKNQLIFPKDKKAITKQSNIIYWFKCGGIECEMNILGNQPELLKRDTKNT